MKSGHLVMVILGQNHFPKPLFTLLRICPVFLEFVIESFPVYSKQLRSFALIASCCFDGRFYTLQFCLFIMQGDRGLWLNLAHALFEFIHADIVTLGKQGGTFHHVVEFSQVTRPVVGCNSFLGGRGLFRGLSAQAYRL